MDSSRWWDRLGPISGIIFVALMVGGIATVGDIDVDPTDPAVQIARELADSADEQTVSFVLFALSLVFFVLFMANLRERFSAAVGDGPGRWMVSVFWGGILVYAGGFLIQGLVQAGQTVLDDYGADTQVAKTLFVLGWDSLLLLAPGIILFMGAIAVLTLKGGALPKWLGWFAVLGAVAGIAPWIPLFVLWVLVASIYLLTRGGRSAAETPAEAPATA